MNKFGLAPEYESQPAGGLLLMLIKIIVLEINSTLKGIRKHHNDFLGVTKETKELPVVFFHSAYLSTIL